MGGNLGHFLLCGKGIGRGGDGADWRECKGKRWVGLEIKGHGRKLMGAEWCGQGCRDRVGKRCD